MLYITEPDIRYSHDIIVAPQHGPFGYLPHRSANTVMKKIDELMELDRIPSSLFLAASYGVYIAKAELFEKGNKRTAFMCMDLVLRLNGIYKTYPTEEAVHNITQASLGRMDNCELSYWLMRLPFQCYPL